MTVYADDEDTGHSSFSTGTSGGLLSLKISFRVARGKTRWSRFCRMGLDEGNTGVFGGITGLTIKTLYSFYAGNVVRLGINGLEQM